MAVAWSYTKSTNIAVVTGGTSGTPATFATAVTADRAGSVTLKAAAAPSLTLTLTYQITPVELRALLISFVIAAKTTETDYIGITGTDAWDAAQTEVINVSAGNGTYVSTKRFRTITNICCTDSATGAGGTVWADGTLAVTQPQWGAFWDLSEVNAVRQDCRIVLGDGSTSTYFKETDKVILIGPGACSADWQKIYEKTQNVTVHLGNVIDETKRLVANPCVISNLANPYQGHTLYDLYGPSYLYGTVILGTKAKFGTTQVRGESRVWHTYQSFDAATGFDSDTIAFNMKIIAGGYCINSTECDVMEDIISIGDNSGWSPALLLYTTGTIGISNVNLYGHSHVILISGTWGGTYNLTNINNYPILSTAWPVYFDTGSSATVNRINTFDLNVCNENGIPMSGAAVDAQDENDDFVWAEGTVTTDADGQITQQSILYEVYTAGAAATTPTIVLKSPHTFTISKAGYKTLVKQNIFMFEAVSWHVELQPNESHAQSRIVSIGVM